MIRTFYLLFITSALVLAGCNGTNQGSEQSAGESSGQSEEPSEQNTAVSFDNDEEKLSYGIGMNIGFSLVRQSVPGFNLDAVILGIRDSVAGTEPQVPEADIQAAVTRLQEAEAAEMAKLVAENATKGAEYLETNAQREGVLSTDSGLQYEVLKEGEGEMPTAESVVKTHYHGTLIDGTVFDSSVDRGKPAQFAVNQVIPGWTEVLQLMKTGGKVRVHVPSVLAYGEASPGPGIPPNSTLIFDIELIEIINKDKDIES